MPSRRRNQKYFSKIINITEENKCLSYLLVEGSLLVVILCIILLCLVNETYTFYIRCDVHVYIFRKYECENIFYLMSSNIMDGINKIEL